MENKREKGKLSENLACEFLTVNGYEIIDRNYHCSNRGEIDIVARDKDGTIAIIEVKSRFNLEMGYPEEAVTFNKRNQIKKMAALYVGVKGIWDTLIRYDVISVLFKDGEEPEIIHMKDAFY
jgi:putative endonuclease